MFVSLDGLLCQMKGRKAQRFMVGKFLQHYAMAKRAHVSGDSAMLAKFFELYVISDQWLHDPVDNQAGGCG